MEVNLTELASQANNTEFEIAKAFIEMLIGLDRECVIKISHKT